MFNMVNYDRERGCECVDYRLFVFFDCQSMLMGV